MVILGDLTATGDSRSSGPLVLVLTSPGQLVPGPQGPLAQRQATRSLRVGGSARGGRPLWASLSVTELVNLTRNYGGYPGLVSHSHAFGGSTQELV